MTSIRQQKSSAPRGAVRTHMFKRWAGAEVTGQALQTLVQQRRHRWARRHGSGRAGVRGASISWKGRREAIGSDQHRLLVDRHDALASAHLLGDQIAEQALSHRASRVGARTLALPCHRGWDEAQRI